MSDFKPFVDATERERARTGDNYVNFYNEALEASKMFRKEYKDRMNVVKWHEMPMERSADGLIKHIINERMDTKECCIDIYMQFIPANGATGTSRHLSEEVAFVIEGTGYDLHYDVRFDCKDVMPDDELNASVNFVVDKISQKSKTANLENGGTAKDS